MHNFFAKIPTLATKSAACGADIVQFFALPGRPFCRKKVDRAEKVCDIVTTHADEMVCQFSAENGRSYMRIARALIFFWGKCDQTTSDSGKFRIRCPDVPARARPCVRGAPGQGAAEGRPLGVFPQDMRGVCKYVLNCSFYRPTPSAQESRHLLHSEALCTPA